MRWSLVDQYSVGNSTMTITTLILLLATGILAVTAVDICPNKSISITSCCDLKSFFTFTKNVASGVYVLKSFCGNDCITADAYAYCDTINGGG